MGAAAKAAKRKAAREARAKKWEEGGVLAKFSVLVSSALEFAGDNLIATICTFVLLFGSFCYWMCCRDEDDFGYGDNDISYEEVEEEEKEDEPVPQSSVPASDAKDAAAAESAAKASGKKS